MLYRLNLRNYESQIPGKSIELNGRTAKIPRRANGEALELVHSRVTIGFASMHF